MSNLNDLQSWFSTARNEYESTNHSVYESFVVPPDIEANDISKIEHSMVLVGGRGTGKTVFLKYFSHWTQFDSKRTDVTQSDLESVILYWKPDTAFCRALKPEWLGDEGSKTAFLSLVTLEIVKEFISALKNIGFHFPEIKKEIFQDAAFWLGVSKVIGKSVTNESTFDAEVEMAIYDAQTEPDNIANKTNPKSALDLLINRVVSVASCWFSNSSFKVFVDEFENLSEEQQRLFNNYRKHSDARLSWNVAYKKFASISIETSGSEKLNQNDDFHTLNLFDELTDDQYKLFIAEIILNNMVRRGLVSDNIPGFTPEFLCDRKNLEHRSSDLYKKKVLQEVKRIFPQPSVFELCKIACANKTVFKKLQKVFLDIGFEKLFSDKVIRKFPDVAIAHFIIFYQKGFQKNLIKESDKLIEFIDSNRTKHQTIDTKINTYVFSALLSLNLDNSYVNIPVYSGFDRYCYLSSRSVRSLISLIFCTIRTSKKNDQASFSKIEEIPAFTFEQMQMGVLAASEQSIGEIVNFTPNGITLSKFTHRLGQILRLIQSVRGQSEPEVNHFSIASDYGDFSKEAKSLIEVAKSWRILIVSNATKERNEVAEAAYEYKLNPFYAPYFGISYRKKRKLKLSLSDFEALYSADQNRYSMLRKGYEQEIEDKRISDNTKGLIKEQTGLDL